jgi:hypothetical protein
MAIHNTGRIPHRQHFYGLEDDEKPTNVYPGDRFYEFDTGKHFIWNGTTWVEYFSPALYKEEQP